MADKLVNILLADASIIPFPVERLSPSAHLAEGASKASTLDASKREPAHLKVLLPCLLFGIESVADAMIPVDVDSFVQFLSEMRLVGSWGAAFVDRIMDVHKTLPISRQIMIDAALGPPTDGWPFIQRLGDRKRSREDDVNSVILKLSKRSLMDIVSRLDF